MFGYAAGICVRFDFAFVGCGLVCCDWLLVLGSDFVWLL